MSNHKWNKENKCVHCSVVRQMIFPLWHYFVNGVWVPKRPDCKKQKV